MSKNSSTAKKKESQKSQALSVDTYVVCFCVGDSCAVLSVLHICHSDGEISLYKGLMRADQNIHRAMAMQSTTAKLTKKQAETFRV